MARPEPVAFSEKRLRQILALNEEGLSIQTMLRSFGMPDSDAAFLEKYLAALKEEGFLRLDKKRGKYEAVQPMSDLVVARVSESLRNGTATLKIEGLDEDFPFKVSLTSNQLKRVRDKRKVQTGDRLAVVLTRHNGSELKARIYGLFAGGKVPSIVGHFKRAASEPTFVSFDKGIRTTFAAAGQVPEKIDPRKSYWAAIPADLDPFAPVLKIGEQKWAPETGTPIAITIARKHGIEIGHPKDVMIDARAETKRTLSLEGRRDLRHEKICVIDPVDARDNDDGILIESTKEGYRTLVVVSDVPYYVRPETSLDAAAKKRGFTHYFPDETYHMLPKKLVQHASLKEGAEKPVIYVEQFWDKKGNQTGHAEIGTGIIAAQKQYTYRQFEDLIQAEVRSAQILPYVGLGNILVERLREDKLNFDTEGVDPEGRFSQALVSAMMIEANAAIAEHLDYHNVSFLSRSHSSSDNLYAFEEIRAKLGEWKYDVPDHISQMNVDILNGILQEAALRDRETRGEHKKVEDFIRSKFLSLAAYTTQPYSHWGLGRDFYAHCTSPIRRYPDIIALRGVHTTLGNEELGLSEDDIDLLDRTAVSMNLLQDTARRVALDRLKYYATRDLLRLEGHIVRGTIGKVNEHTAEIILPERGGLRKRIDVRQLPEGWGLSRAFNCLTYKGNVIPAGTPIRLRITDVRPQEADWDMAEIELPAKFHPPAPAKAAGKVLAA